MPKIKKTKKKQKRPKKLEKTIKVKKTKLIPILDEEDEDESGIYIDKEDMQILYNAISKYTPSEKERQNYELLLEEFEEMLVVD
jgi:hypothetical protein